MERVLAEGSMDAIVEVVAAVIPFPLIIADLAADTFTVRRSPAPKLMSEPEWARAVSQELAPELAALLRSNASSGFKVAQSLTVRHGRGATTIRAVVEPLRVQSETVGGLIIFPSGEGLDDLDAMVAQAARLALNVQLMRDHVRFRSETSSLTEVFKTLFAGAPRHSGELVARARRHGVSLPGPGRLVALGLSNEGSQPADAPSTGLHLSSLAPQPIYGQVLSSWLMTTSSSSLPRAAKKNPNVGPASSAAC